MIPYLLHVALLISVCLLFYKLLLQRETFYRLNRIVLVFCLALSFALPLIPIPQQWALRETAKPTIVKTEPSAVQPPVVAAPKNEVAVQDIAVKPSVFTDIKDTPPSIVKQTSTSPDVPFMQRAIKWLFYLYWIGVAAFGLNLLMQIVVLLYQAYTKPAIRDGKFRIVELSGDKAPCSFGNNIFINPEKYDWDTYSQILLHEKIHIQQGHSFDILVAELVLVVQWFNPFAWLYRTELENNLEFLTDSSVLEHKEVERESYQMSLLKVSAPHLSLGITTNYNQSLLKKRIVMMNAKKSNIHIMWKYFFLVPMLGVLACVLNDPAAYSMTAKAIAKSSIKAKKDTDKATNDRTEGAWFATIKGDKVHIEFKSDDDDRNWSSSSTFPMSEFSALPKDQKGEFTLKREAGTVVFTGKFEGDEGYGHYKFTADKSFNSFLNSLGITEVEDGDSFAFFTLDIKKDYVSMLQKSGYKDLSKHNLISMSALRVDEAYINMWKANGYNDLSPNELVSGKALGITSEYVSEIRKAGYKDISFNQLVSFKAQNITGAYINGLRKTKMKTGANTGEEVMPSANEISSYKAMNIDSSYVHSLAAVGYSNIPYHELTTLKALNITAAYIKSFKEIGYTNLTVNSLTTLKSLDITPAYIKSFEALGYKNLSVNNLSSLKALGITGDYIKGFEAIGYKNLTVNNLSTLKSLGITEDYIKGFESLGYKNLSVNNLSSLKALGINDEYIKSFEAIGYKNIPVNSLNTLKALDITPDFVKGFKDLGFTDISVNQLSSLKATGVTPAYITEMRGKGFNSTDVEKYVRLKTAFN
ncbi:beta-lactamase regulating signal transducer with metallopeptidase domain [Mucilaginibacter frigoritolerans]|uniref:Beta-lactamase regulating signal transducer with metallopeptidase domain n=1 Tax=Mucilaginibacter frigoritolerans TaxID=652788 RepID=A0A562UH00_9SPHI|nr:M56 family metallopeptidase [Mucilaginibacter frigoritolerans]TWJ04667.1 beta-lactamase regulating signal transducer with metallopeptidase domain [Mucilaginibacter frigoritolerans]